MVMYETLIFPRKITLGSQSLSYGNSMKTFQNLLKALFFSHCEQPDSLRVLPTTPEGIIRLMIADRWIFFRSSISGLPTISIQSATHSSPDAFFETGAAKGTGVSLMFI
jgi:hypothetical protein